MLATLTSKRFSDPGWIFERKLDGERVLAFRNAGEVRLLSRNRLVLNVSYPEVVEALAAQPTTDFVVDGEVVAFDHGRTSFAKLQRRMGVHDPEESRRRGVPVFYYVFDLLRLNGEVVRPLPLRRRKGLLRSALQFGGPLRFTLHRIGDGEAYFEEACRKGWEGVIAKRADAPYVGGRSRDWLKFKCVNEQEFVIGGWTEPKGSRTGLGALLVGYFEAGQLRYAGKVGTGYSTQTLRELVAQLTPLERPTSAFAPDSLPRRDVHWAEPRLVAQIGFSEWTRDGRLRHPRFIGLRRDKAAQDVVREIPAGLGR